MAKEFLKLIRNHHVLTAMLVFCAFGALTFVFSMMWVTGSVKAVEDTLGVRGVELGLSVVFCTYGGWRFWREVRR